MNFSRMVDMNYSYLTETEKNAVRKIRQNKSDIQQKNSTETAKLLGVSRATLIRLIKKLGMSSYMEFQLVLKQEMDMTAKSRVDMESVAKDYHNMIETIKKYDYNEICGQIYRADTIYLYGTGNEQKAIAEEFKRIFLIMGKWCVDLFDYGEIEFAAKKFSDKDLFIAISLSGENKEVLDIMGMVCETKIHTLSVTRWNNNSLARITENNLYVGTKLLSKDEQDSYEMITAFYILLDILSVKYLELKENKTSTTKN